MLENKLNNKMSKDKKIKDGYVKVTSIGKKKQFKDAAGNVVEERAILPKGDYIVTEEKAAGFKKNGYLAK